MQDQMVDLPALSDRKAWARWLYANAPGYVCDAILGGVTRSTGKIRRELRILESKTEMETKREQTMAQTWKAGQRRPGTQNPDEG